MLGTLLISASIASTTPVLVLDFTPDTPSAAGLAVILPSLLIEHLSTLDYLSIVSIEDVSVGYLTGPSYIESCPTGNEQECALVVGQAGKADYVVTGFVAEEDGIVSVFVTLIDVLATRECVTFQAEFEPGQQGRFITGSGELLEQLIQGEIGREIDIRDLEEDEFDPVYREQVKAELDALSDELSELKLISLDKTITIKKELVSYSEEDLLLDSEMEGTKPWEKYSFTPEEYLAYKNSGLTADEYSSLLKGKKGRLSIRTFLGGKWGPYSGRYHSRYSYQLTTDGLEVGEIYAYQALESSFGVLVGVELGVGFTPTMEVILGYQHIAGKYYIMFQQEAEGVEVVPDDYSHFSNSSQELSLGLKYVKGPTKIFRPLVSTSFNMLFAPGAEKHTAFLSSVDLPKFDSLVLPGFQISGGFEVTLGRHLDLVFEVPFGMVFGKLEEVHDENKGLIFDKEAPNPVLPLSAGFQVSLQTKIGR